MRILARFVGCYCAQNWPGLPPRTLQLFASPLNALHEPGSAAPKVVQTPLPPATIEHCPVGWRNVEQRFAGPGCPACAEQKLRQIEPALSTEHWLAVVVWLCALQVESPCPLMEQSWRSPCPTAEQTYSSLGSRGKVLQPEGV